MEEINDGDLLANDGIVVEVDGNSYAVTNPTNGDFILYNSINNYQGHDTILAHPNTVFCPECGVEAETDEEDFPYVKMLHELPNECEPIERFK